MLTDPALEWASERLWSQAPRGAGGHTILLSALLVLLPCPESAGSWSLHLLPLSLDIQNKHFMLTSNYIAH